MKVKYSRTVNENFTCTVLLFFFFIFRYRKYVSCTSSNNYLKYIRETKPVMKKMKNNYIFRRINRFTSKALASIPSENVFPYRVPYCGCAQPSGFLFVVKSFFFFLWKHRVCNQIMFEKLVRTLVFNIYLFNNTNKIFFKSKKTFIKPFLCFFFYNNFVGTVISVCTRRLSAIF